MISMLATDWLALSLLLCVFAWYARRWVALTLPVAVAVAALAIYIPTGSARLIAPPAGDYQLLGAKIVPNVAIWALLDDGKGPPRYYRLPYTTSAASELQNAMDGAQNGQGVKATIDGDGGQTYEGDPPVTGDPPKIPEQPAITLP